MLGFSRGDGVNNDLSVELAPVIIFYTASVAGKRLHYAKGIFADVRQPVIRGNIYPEVVTDQDGQSWISLPHALSSQDGQCIVVPWTGAKPVL
jgi:hypothetical protein